MIHPIPSGTRDVLPDEMRELRAIERALREVFEQAGYGEVATPALEHETVLRRGGTAPPAYRVFDDHGNVLALRSDMTVPIARVAATRYATVEPPLRFFYIANAYRQVRPHRGQMREFKQAGIELLGPERPVGTAEVLRVLCTALEAIGLADFRIGLGSRAVLRSVFDDDVDEAAVDALEQALSARDLVSVERLAAEAGIADEVTRTLALRGGPEVLDSAPVPAAAERLRALYELLDDDVARRVIFDLGLSRGLGYYTGAVFEVYAPGIGAPLGGGGRYDELLGRFGRPLPAAGFALTIDRLHEALTRSP